MYTFQLFDRFVMQKSLLGAVDEILNGLSEFVATRVRRRSKNLARNNVLFGRRQILNKIRQGLHNGLHVPAGTRVDVQALVEIREVVFRQDVVTHQCSQDTQLLWAQV